ncbi:MAG: hypothetical protein EA357_05170 [Micavibrio sp.]|nr:MAG: hypothetical protein EA357_05170 [Micavibrio sp.]
MFAERYIIQGNKDNFDRIRNISEHFGKVASINAEQHSVTLTEKPKGYFERKLKGAGAQIIEMRNRHYPDDPYHSRYYC